MKPKRREPGISDAEYARHRGCSKNTVSVARRDGRLVKCLLPNGRIRSAGAADAEWETTTRLEHVPRIGPTAPRHSGGTGPADYAAARLRREVAEAEKAEVALAAEKGQLVPADEVREQIEADYTAVRTKVLGVPSRLRLADPTLTVDQVEIVRRLLREALEDLANGDGVEERGGA